MMENFELGIQDIIKIILKRIWIIIISIILVSALALSYSVFIVEPLYTSSTTMYVSPKSDQMQSSILNDISSYTYAKQLVSTYIQILQTNAFRTKLSERCGNIYTPNDFIHMISIENITDTELFTIKITAESPEITYNLALLIEEIAPESIIEIMGVDSIKIADPAVMSYKPSNDNGLRNAAIGALLGAVLSVGISILCEVSDTSIKSSEDLKSKYNIPVLGEIIDFEMIIKSGSDKAGKERWEEDG